MLTHSVNSHLLHCSTLIGWLEFNVPFQHKYGYIRDDLIIDILTENWYCI